MKQFNNLIEFRQAIYEYGLPKAQDAQFELVDALLLGSRIRSFPELSLSPVFRRKWPSAYAALEDREQNREWLEKLCVGQIPTESVQVFSLDGTAWPHPEARTLLDRQYVYSGGEIVIGHPYSILARVPEPDTSWALPVSTRRVLSEQTDTEVGVAQVKRLCRLRGEEMRQGLHLVVGDCKYGNHRFLGPLKDEPCGALVRMRRDRVLYGEPGPYRGVGRPRVHGDRFVFKEPETWGEPDEEVELDDERWGKVRLRRWDNKHARQDAGTVLSIILVETHLERDKPSAPFWLGHQPLAYQPPPHQEPGTQDLVDLWHWYDWRWPVEPSIRFRKQYLHWTTPQFQEPEKCDRWTSSLIDVAQWELFLARDVVQDEPLPWQPPQERLTPERTLQSLGATFREIGTPAAPPQTRGKSPGWPKRRPRTRRKRHPVVKKG